MRACGSILLLGAFACACSDGERYELTLSPAEVSTSPPESFTIRVLTRFSNTPRIYRTHVVVTAEPTGILSPLDAADIAYDDEATQPGFDAGPPPSYWFQPRNPTECYAIQTLTYQCLTTGEITLAFDVTWSGGEPEDPQATVETEQGSVPVACN